ncbi:MAG: hypothetical protein ABIT37_10605 [Luteolibacter sp.]
MIHLAEQFLLRRVAVLCARKDSVYHGVSGVDVYCARRDARNFVGSCPVVAHPPCRRFGRLRQFVPESAGADSERFLGVWCADQVRHYGGVLEHPSYSTLWDRCGLPRPGEKSLEGVTIAIPQYWFGHRARKSTWLFVARLQLSDIPDMPYRLETFDMKEVARMGRGEREHTPPDLAKWLVDLAVLSGDRPRYQWTGREVIPPRSKLKEWIERNRAGTDLKGKLTDRPDDKLKVWEFQLCF